MLFILANEEMFHVCFMFWPIGIDRQFQLIYNELICGIMPFNSLNELLQIYQNIILRFDDCFYYNFLGGCQKEEGEG